MKRQLVYGVMAVILCIFGFGSFQGTYAEDTDSTVSLRPHSLHKGTYALHFGFSSFTLTSWQGMAFYGKYHLSDSKAIRAGFGLGWQNEDRNYDSNDYSNSDKDLKTDENKNYLALRLHCQYMKYLELHDNFKWYYSIGPTAAFSYQNNLYVVNNEIDKVWTEYVRRELNVYNTWIDIMGGIGIEWFLSRRLSFIAEYSVSLTYRYEWVENHEYNTKEDSIQQNHYWSFSTSTANLGLALYF